MTAIPARVAGVREIVLVTPPGRDGPVARGRPGRRAHRRRHRGLADRRGAGDRRAGVRHADHPPRGQDRGARQHLRGAGQGARSSATSGIDMIAGPSEVVVVADASADPALVAADLLAQAEHDPMARALLITDAPDAAAARGSGARRPAGATVAPGHRRRVDGRNGAFILVADLDAAVELANRLAPEHLELCVRVPDALLPAGAPAPAPSSWARTRRKWWATTWPGPTTCCPTGGHGALRLAPGHRRLRDAVERDRVHGRRAAAALPHLRALAGSRGSTRTRGRPRYGRQRTREPGEGPRSIRRRSDERCRAAVPRRAQDQGDRDRRPARTRRHRQCRRSRRPIPFFSHMLEAWSKHGLMDLAVEATGDWRSTSTTRWRTSALVLGRALDEALGDKRGIVRFGTAFVPMDEALVQASVDLSGRPYPRLQRAAPARTRWPASTSICSSSSSAPSPPRRR